MKKYSCFVIDDMHATIAKLKGYIETTAWLCFDGSETNALTALDKIGRREIVPDIIFLDAEMPEVSGIDLAKELADISDARVIFATAYRKYAYEAYKVGAVDYLLKPFDYKDFMGAVLKVDALKGGDVVSLYPQRFMFLKVDHKQVKVYFNTLLCLEAERNYVRVKTRMGQYLVHGTLTEIASKLPPDIFCQLHRSFVVNLNRIVQIEAAAVQLDNGDRVTLGEKYKPHFYAQMHRFTSGRSRN